MYQPENRVEVLPSRAYICISISPPGGFEQLVPKVRLHSLHETRKWGRSDDDDNDDDNFDDDSDNDNDEDDNYKPLDNKNGAFLIFYFQMTFVAGEKKDSGSSH